jgi:formylglycine-generating enzyme required for sulfatase activity
MRLMRLYLVSALAFAVSACSGTTVPGPHSPRNSEGTLNATQEAQEITNSLGMKLVVIPHGTFQMGSPAGEKGRHDDEGPQHEVQITKDFYMAKFAVTRGQFRQFVENTGYKTDAEKDGKGGWGYVETKDGKGSFPQKDIFNWRRTGFEQTDEHPVVNVSWNDAQAFCEWLGRKEDKPYRLPTEAEWEYACRAGTSTRYYNGDEDGGLRQVANIADRSLAAKWDHSGLHNPDFKKALISWLEEVSWSDGYPFTAPVGQFRSNAWGLYDMHGNVYQWCSDWSDPKYYHRSPRVDPQGPDDGQFRVLRGGSWLDFPRWCRSARRSGLQPTDRWHCVGFRVVVSTDRRTP